jgi:hypothetical protein
VDGPYTVLPNRIVQSADLSPEAFRVLTYIASLPEDWNLRVEQVAKRCRIGRDSVYDAYAELEGMGLARHMVERGARGRLARRWWEFTLTPWQWAARDPDTQQGTCSWDSGTRRKARRPLAPDSPDQVPPDQVGTTLQCQIKDKDHKREKAHFDRGSPGGVRSEGGAPLLGAVPTERYSAAGEQWPFPEDAHVTRRVRGLQVEPSTLWRHFQEQRRAGKIPQVPRNLAGYLVAMAKRMAPKGDPSVLEQARRDLSRRGQR